MPSGAEDTVQALLEQALGVFQVRGAAVFSLATASRTATAAQGQTGDGNFRPPWPQSGPARRRHRRGDATGDNIEEIDSSTRLVLFGRILPASDRRLLGAFGVHLAAQLERQQLVASRREMLRLAESNTMRTSILRAVSHDLRTPLAGIKLAVGGLRHDDVHYTPEEEQELLATIEECSDRLDALVGNLLDMSRITSDAVNPLLKPVRWYEVIPGALSAVPAGRVRVDLPANMPEVDADPGMLERVDCEHRRERREIRSRFGHRPGRGGWRAQPCDSRRAALPGSCASSITAGESRRRASWKCSGPSSGSTTPRKPPAIGLGLGRGEGVHGCHGRQPDRGSTPGGGLTMVIRLPLSTGDPI